jgi:5-methylcytosine-specific restriction endonuclease McrA
MNFGMGGTLSVILMSIRPNAPYNDRLEDGGTTLIYEGHNAPKRRGQPDPKTVDQPERNSRGGLTQNGRFHWAAQGARTESRPPERVRVYEKLRDGIWSYNGVFHLVDSWQEIVNARSVFKFKLFAIAEGDDLAETLAPVPERRRVIPTDIKVQVWKRDRGKCVKCGASDELHFDHIVPYSRGGTSILLANVQLLCARHNLEKHDRIE